MLRKNLLLHIVITALWLPLLVVVDGLVLNNGKKDHHCCVVIGKIIIDEYKKPGQDKAVVSVGGGGPQAAWGAAAALAVLDEQYRLLKSSARDEYSEFPPPQPVTFLGPVGKWAKEENDSLLSVLQPAVASIHLIEESTLSTPKIQLWHDEKQNIQWFPLEGSWGEAGADSLWRNRPSAQDVLDAVKGGDEGRSNIVINSLFLIMEGGEMAAGNGEDSFLLADPTLMRQTKLVGIEPVAFPNEETGLVSDQDSNSCQRRIAKYPKIDFVAPDRHLFEAVDPTFWHQYNVAARYGADGSIACPIATSESIKIPAAALTTNEAVNPTGAGNAYSSAVTACLGKGLTLLEAAYIGTAVGAAVCEHEHLPPWTWETITRIREGANEVKQRIESNEMAAKETKGTSKSL